MPEPTKIPRPFADSGDKNSIPDSSGSIGFASWQEGFPAITSEPFSQGGVAPKRADFNGIFNALSAATVWNQQGGVYAYDATTDYEIGNVVEYNNDLYKCIVANGPNSAVKNPTQTSFWSKIMTTPDTDALYVPFAGGANYPMTGNLWGGGSSNWYISMLSEDKLLTLRSANAIGKGAYLALFGQSHATAPSRFEMVASGNSIQKALIGETNGSLTWDGNKLITTADVATTLVAGAMSATDKTLVDNLSSHWSGGDLVTIQTGTWTPVLSGTTIAGSFTYNYNKAYYYKLNDLVFFRFVFNITNCDTQPTGNIKLTGWPFTIANDVVDGINVTRSTGGTVDSMRRIARFRCGNSGNAYAEVIDCTSGAFVTASFVTSMTSPLSSNAAANICIPTGTVNIELAGSGFYATNQ